MDKAIFKGLDQHAWAPGMKKGWHQASLCNGAV
jgi:hypothetical protein